MPDQTEGPQDDRTRIAQQFIEAIPHARPGHASEETGAGRATIGMPWAEHLVGDPRTGVIHGGVVSALMDTCCGAAVMVASGNPPSARDDRTCASIMRRAARRGQRITARAECYRMTRSVVFSARRGAGRGRAPRPWRPRPAPSAAENEIMGDRNEPPTRAGRAAIRR